MKTFCITLAAVCLSYSLFGQGYQPPQNFDPKTAEDYAPFEKDVIECASWLMETPIGQMVETRKSANAFLLKWLMGSPYLHITIKQEIVTFMGTSPDLLMIFMAGWAKYGLESRNFDDKIGGSLAAIEAVITFYGSNKKVLPKDKHVEQYIKLKKKGELEDYIRANV